MPEVVKPLCLFRGIFGYFVRRLLEDFLKLTEIEKNIKSGENESELSIKYLLKPDGKRRS